MRLGELPFALAGTDTIGQRGLMDALHLMEPLERFSGRATDYAKYRPGYPTETIDQILEGLPAEIVVADVGAGTGISARLFGDRNHSVWAIEPNADMTNSAEPHPNVQYRQASAENTGLPAVSIDLITCFQSFHWFEPKATLTEFQRILKPRGRVALVWNSRDRTDPFTNTYGRLLEDASDKHPALKRVNVSQTLLTSPWFIHPQTYDYASHQPLDLQGLKGSSTSRSYVPLEGEKFETLMQNLDALYEQFRDEHGLVYMKHITQLAIAESP
jgi:ubiquinone/menaquinone biosynthesis C-methylase UbiE